MSCKTYFSLRFFSSPACSSSVLDLSGNSLTDRGVQSLCASLAVGAAPSLTEVRLAGNPLGDGVKALEGLAMMRKDIVFDVKA